MKKYKYIISILSVIIFISSCSENEISNPELTDSDLSVYFWGEGDNVTGIAWEGYDVLIGESLDIKLQVSPKQDTSVKWVDDATGEVLSESLDFTYAPTKEEALRVNFIATRTSGYEKKIVFNFRGNIDGFTSKINDWQSILIPQGTQTGTFTVEFDMIPSKDIMNGVVGILDGIATTYSNNSVIVRLNPSGKIDAFNDTGYAANNELIYHGGVTYHIKIDVDAVNQTYDVFATEQGGNVVEIGSAFKFRRKITHLDYWSMNSDNFNLADPGTHRVLNMQFTTHTQNQAPVFTSVDDATMQEGTELKIDIEATDPLGGNLILEANNLPRFAVFVDNGFGKGTLTFKPYDNCAGCDLGTFDINIVATNSAQSSSLDFTLEVEDPNAGFEIEVDEADGTLWDNGAIDSTFGETVLGHNGAGAGGDGNVVAIMPFALPNIPAGKKVKSAKLKLNVTHNAGWFPVEYDIYGISARASSEVLTSDFFLNTYDTDATATGIQKAFMTNTTGIGEVTMEDSSAKNVANFMNAQYDSGATTGEFIFLRINASRSDMPTWAILKFESGNSTATTPVLVVTLEDK